MKDEISGHLPSTTREQRISRATAMATDHSGSRPAWCNTPVVGSGLAQTALDTLSPFSPLVMPRQGSQTMKTLAMVLLSLVLNGRALAEQVATPGNNHVHFYVSPRGNDRWAGRLPAPNPLGTDGPFATLVGARNAVRELRSGQRIPGPVTVMVLGGTYCLTEPLVLSNRDSGSEAEPITYAAYPDQKPVLTGGRRITGWKPYKESILQCHLPEAKGGRWSFRQLFFNGKRQIRTRWPNRDPHEPLYGGWAFIDSTFPDDDEKAPGFRYAPNVRPRHWSSTGQAEVNVFPWYCWVNDIIPVKQIDADKRTITLGRQVRPGFMSLMPGNRFCVENVLEELDQPGEWCLDGETGTLYFWPPTENTQDSQTIAPRIDQLIVVRGTPDKPVRHITISGLTFSHTLSPYPEQQPEDFHSPTLRGAGVTLQHCEDCCVTDNRFFMLGGDAVRLHSANARNQIVGNEIAFVGGAGISLASDGPGNTHTWADQAVLRQNSQQYPRSIRNVISNNHIHHCGVIKKNCGGVQLYGINSIDNVISHNLIHHMSDKGLTMQDGFGRFIVEYNELYQLGLEIADTGGLMTNRWFVLEGDPELGQGNVIRFNLIRDCIGCAAYDEQRHPKGEGDKTTADGRIWTPYYTWGVYFDNSGVDITVYGNIITSTVLGGVSMTVGSAKNNRVENNIFISNSGNQIDLRMGSRAFGNRFLRNILYYTNRDAALLAALPAAGDTIAQCDYNIYHPAAGQPLRIRGIGDETFSDWRKLGFDEHSLIADPLFVDPAGGDYRLKPESPAHKLGFQPIDIDRIGLQEKYRARLPARVQRDLR